MFPIDRNITAEELIDQFSQFVNCHLKYNEASTPTSNDLYGKDTTDNDHKQRLRTRYLEFARQFDGIDRINDHELGSDSERLRKNLAEPLNDIHAAISQYGNSVGALLEKLRKRNVLSCKNSLIEVKSIFERFENFNSVVSSVVGLLLKSGSFENGFPEHIVETITKINCALKTTQQAIIDRKAKLIGLNFPKIKYLEGLVSELNVEKGTTLFRDKNELLSKIRIFFDNSDPGKGPQDVKQTYEAEYSEFLKDFNELRKKNNDQKEQLLVSNSLRPIADKIKELPRGNSAAGHKAVILQNAVAKVKTCMKEIAESLDQVNIEYEADSLIKHLQSIKESPELSNYRSQYGSRFIFTTLFRRDEEYLGTRVESVRLIDNLIKNIEEKYISKSAKSQSQLQHANGK